MLKRLMCLVLAAGALHAPPAQAGIYLSGTDLYADCSVPKDNPVYYSRTERCTGFITGVVDATEGLRAMLDLPYCVPPEVTLGQLNGVVLTYIEAHPNTRSLAAASLVLSALTEGYNCTALGSGEAAPATPPR
jgi:hypothetical protein